MVKISVSVSAISSSPAVNCVKKMGELKSRCSSEEFSATEVEFSMQRDIFLQVFTDSILHKTQEEKLPSCKDGHFSWGCSLIFSFSLFKLIKFAISPIQLSQYVYFISILYLFLKQ